MATQIQIKRTSTANLPSTLEQGEMAYVYDTSSTGDGAGNNGGRLFIGDPTSNTNTPIKIGGKYYTDLLDHSQGQLTASAALVVDANKKINELFVDNLKLDGNILSSTDTNGNINITPDGLGKTVVSNLHIGDDATTLQEFIEDITGGAVSADEVTLTASYDDTAGTITIAIADSGVDTTQLADNAVTDAKLSSSATLDSDRAVSTDHIQSNAVTSAKLASSATTDSERAVTTSHIKDSAVTTDKIATNAITATELADDAVDTAAINDNAVTADKINTAAVTEGKIAAGAVSTIKLGNDAVTTSKIADLTVTEAKIAGSAITTGKVADSAITAVKLADGSVTTGKLSTGAVTATQLAADAVSTAKIVDGAVTNDKLANSDITIGTTGITLGGSSTTISGLTSVEIDELTIDTNEVRATQTNANIVLNPNGTGTIIVPSGYADRSGFGDQSLVPKSYVDQVATGLDVKESVKASSTEPLTATYDNGSSGIGATLTSVSNEKLVLDDISVAVGDRVLIKNQTNAFENGTYVVTNTGTAGAAQWVITRAGDGDESDEVAGGSFFFITEGTDFGDAGFVATHDGFPVIGTDGISFEQFSGAGQLSAGTGISKVGNLLQVNVDDVTVEVNGADELQIKDNSITNTKVSPTAAIVQSKLAMNNATGRSAATGLTQADKGLASFDSNQFTVTNGWATVVRLDGGTYS